MTRPWNHAWRLIATGLCFAVFGAGGLLLSVLVFPLLLLLPRRHRSRTSRWMIHRSFGGLLRLMESLGVMRLSIRGGDKLRDCRGTLILANHPTLIDVVVLISLMPDASCVVKQALWKNPLLGGAVRAADYISNSEPETLVDDCTRDLASGHPLIIFPEGTRTLPGRPLRFLRGAAYIALKSDVPILPVLISCQPSTLSKHDKWYRIPSRRFELRVDVLEPVTVCRWVTAHDAPALTARKLTHALEDHFTQAIQRHGLTQT